MNTQLVHLHLPENRYSATIHSIADYKLERDISAMHARLIASTDRVEQRMAAARMCFLVGQRSPEMVSRMEKAKGLA